jgi:hypothetical protein
MSELPEPYGWIALGRFFTDRQAAIAAAEKTPVTDVWCRPQLLALAAQRDEGLAREAELRERLAEARTALKYLMERFEAEVCVCDNCGEEKPLTDSDSAEYLREFLASPGCADGEKIECGACPGCTGTCRHREETP